MTVQDLWSHALKGAKAVEPVKLHQLNGATIGIDVSIWLHRVCALDDVALCMTCQPRYPPTAAISSLKSWHNALVAEGITHTTFLMGDVIP